jgi:signal transduction histidine kinase
MTVNLRKTIRELEDKNAELERFAYTVSHDLKSPIVTVKGYAGMLERDLEKGDLEQLRSKIRRIDGAADRMRRLLDELLELSRIGRVVSPPEDVPLAGLARDATTALTTEIQARGVRVDIAPDLPVVRGDRVRLHEVLQNLMENAVRFMGDQPEPHVEVGWREEGGEAVFFVRDNGIGINPRYSETVFGLFNRLDPTKGGTGVGLAVVRRIIMVHGGRVWVESDGEGKGATFYFTIPATGGKE